MRIIPAIDIIDGKCVRLTRGKYSTKKTYSQHPLEVAKEFEANGIEYLHLVDLDGAKSKHIVNQKVVESICSQTNLKVDFGGGLKALNDVRIAFECGANQITCGSVAVNDPVTFLQWVSEFGADKVILGADCINRVIATSGWQDQSQWDVVDFITEYEQKGINYVTCTDIDKDGMLNGTSNELYKTILAQSNVNLIASGGVAAIDDLIQLKTLGCEGAIVGKALYEGKITLKQLQKLC